MKKDRAFKAWVVVQKNGIPNGVSFCKTEAQAVEDLDVKYGEALMRITIMLPPKRRRK